MRCIAHKLYGNIVPEQCFDEETNADKTKKFTCKTCGKVYRSKQSGKNHVASSHGNQALKRIRVATGVESEEESNKKQHQDSQGAVHDPLMESTRLEDPNLDETMSIRKNGFEKLS